MGGPTVDVTSGIDSVLVTNTTNSQQKYADIRDTLFVARALPLNDGNNTLTARATDRAGNYWDYPTSGSHTVSIDMTPSVTYGYDSNGNMTTRTVNGSSTTTYTYNCHDQLVQITFPGSPSTWLKFYYDGLGRRIKTEYYDGATTTVRQFVYLGGSVIQELDNSTPPNVLKEYLRGLDLGGGIGGIIYQKVIPEEGPDRYYYYHYNHKGDVVALTDGDGKLAAYYEYDAWGNTMITRTRVKKSSVDNPVEDPAEGGTTPQRNGTRSPACTTLAPVTIPPKSEDGRRETVLGG